MAAGLVLRDVHQPPAPSFWPPAPGWWLVFVVLIASAAVFVFVRRRRAARRAAAISMFDASLTGSTTPAQRLGAASELLRRAARRIRPDADRLDGDAWLALLDTPRTRFVEGPGRLLLDGPFRPSIDAGEADAALHLARERFVELMRARR